MSFIRPTCCFTCTVSAVGNILWSWCANCAVVCCAQEPALSSTVMVASVASPRPSSSMQPFHHHTSLPRPPALSHSRSFDYHRPGPRHRHLAPHHYFGNPPSVRGGFFRPHMNPRSGNPGFRGPADPAMYHHRSSAPNIHGREYASQSPRPSVPSASHHQPEQQSQLYASPLSWASPPGVQGVQMPVQHAQDKFLGPPPPPAQIYTVQQSPSQPGLVPESFTSSPMYAQYSPQVVTPVAPQPQNYGGTSQSQYSPAMPAPSSQQQQQLYVVASPQLIPGMQQMPSSAQFTPTGQLPSMFQVGFVPAGPVLANQMPAGQQQQQSVSSAEPGCIVASPPQQYVIANQPLVMQPAAVNQPFVAAQNYSKTGNVVPSPQQQFIMLPTQQYVIPPTAQQPAGAPPPPVSQFYSIVASQNMPLPQQPNGAAPCIVQPVLSGQRMPVNMAAVPSPFQPIAVPANQLQVMPAAANQIAPMVQVVPVPGAVPASQPPPTVQPAANQIPSSVATSQLAPPPPQPMYCYVPSASVPIGSPVGFVPTNAEFRQAPNTVPSAIPSSVEQQPATASVQVL